MPWTIATYDKPTPDVPDFTGDFVFEIAPENLSFTLNKAENGPSEVNFEVSRSRSVIGPDFVGPYRTYFRLYHGEDLGSTTDDDVVMAGPITMLQVNSREEHAKIAGKSWEHHLEQLFWPFDPSDPNANRYGNPTTTAFNPPPGFAYYHSDTTSAIITDLFNYITSQVNSPYFNINIISLQNITQLLSVDLVDTESLLSKLQSLSQNDDDGFWFRIHPVSRSLDVLNQGGSPSLYSPGFVITTPAHTEYHFDKDVEDSGIYDVSFTNTGPAATWLLGTGNNTSNDLAAVSQYVPAQEIYGLIQQAKSYSDVKTKTQLESLTRRDLLFNVNPVHEITLTVIPDKIPGFWSTFYPGVAIWLTADLEAHTIDSAQEIISMDVGVTNQDNALVTMKLNQIYESVTL